MKVSRRKFSSAFKAQVAIDAIKERETLAELSKRHGVHAVMICKGKPMFIPNIAHFLKCGLEATLRSRTKKYLQFT